MQRFIRALSLLSVFSPLVLSSCTQNRESSTGTQPVGVHVFPVASVSPRNDMVPNFSWTDTTGKSVDFDSYRGKVTLINFWATWCGPCKKELPDLVELSKEYEGKNVKFLGLATDRGSDVANDVARFVQEHHIPYQNLVSSEALEEAFGNVPAIPTSFLIDGQGKIVQTYVGARSKEFFSQAIAALLK
ncbi:MAG TPA: TlpA disulfide reductase family protein [Bacteroidota bacterium]|nr:TlpA disulfide reductase family protein [Bacteroidota bacterium]